LLRFETTFFELLRRGELGLCAYGVPRVGKTTAGQYIRYRLTVEKLAACVFHAIVTGDFAEA
jgi:hypothetical protein